MEVVGRWLMTECNEPRLAIVWETRRLYKLDGVQSRETLFEVLGALHPQDRLSPQRENASPTSGSACGCNRPADAAMRS